MESLSEEVTTGQMRARLAEVVGRAGAGERIGVTRGGHLVAVVVSPEAAEALTAYEAARRDKEGSEGESGEHPIP